MGRINDVYRHGTGGNHGPNPKLNIPPLRPNRVRRRHLLSRLNAGLDRPLTLVSAPAGFGKTTILAEWALAASRHHSLAWLSLDADDNDPSQFLMLVKSAFAQMNDRWRRSLELYQPSPGTSPASAMVPLLGSIDNGSRAESILVLDDYHFTVNPWIHSALAFLVEHLPPHLRLVISSRADPPLPLARLRARDQLTEIRTSDLALSADEAALFLKRVMGIDLPRAEIQKLYAWTEGWVAGLQLVALALRVRQPKDTPQDLVEAASHLTASHPLIADYVSQEVLSRHSPAIQEFLIKTSILDRLTAPLCDALLQTDGSQAHLDYIERANLFLVPLDNERRWYRYHFLFAEWLRRRLEQTQPHLIPELQRRAAQWFAQHRLGREAVRHLLSAGDHGAAADQIELQVRSLLEQGQAATLLTWLDALPREVVWSRLALCLAYGSALNATRQVQRSEPYIRQAQRLLQKLSRQHAPRKELREYRTRLTMIRAMTAMWQGDLSEMVKRSKEALALIPPSSPARVSVGTNLVYGHVLAGEMRAARKAAARVEKAARKIRNPQMQIAALNTRAMVQVSCGELVNAARTCRRALHIADTQDDGKRGSYSLVLLGDILREWNELEQAEECLTEAIERDLRAGSQGSHAGHIHLARTLAAQGKVGLALERLERAEEIMFKRRADEWETQAAAYRARLRIAQEKLDEARNWIKTSGIDLASPRIRSAIPGYLPEIEYLTLVRVLLADRDARGDHTGFEMAQRWLNTLARDAERTGRFGSLIEILALQALLYQAMHKEDRALAALTRAVSMGAPEKYVRTFVDEGAPMLALLQRLVEQTNDSYVRRLVKSFPVDHVCERPSPSTAPEALTSHEVTVLRLIARGLSNQAIADELHVSLNTVRTHTQHLFQKLDVHNRTSAVDVARRQGWL